MGLQLCRMDVGRLDTNVAHAFADEECRRLEQERQRRQYELAHLRQRYSEMLGQETSLQDESRDIQGREMIAISEHERVLQMLITTRSYHQSLLMRSRTELSEAEKEEGSSEYFQRWIVRSRLEDAI